MPKNCSLRLETFPGFYCRIDICLCAYSCLWICIWNRTPALYLRGKRTQATNETSSSMALTFWGRGLMMVFTWRSNIGSKLEIQVPRKAAQRTRPIKKVVLPDPDSDTRPFASFCRGDVSRLETSCGPSFGSSHASPFLGFPGLATRCQSRSHFELSRHVDALCYVQLNFDPRPRTGIFLIDVAR